MKSKIIIITALIMSIVVICTSCSSVTGVLNDSLNMLKKGDVEGFCKTLDISSESVTDNIIAYYKNLNEDKAEIVKKVYSYMTFTVSEKEDTKDVLVLTLNCIFVRKLMDDVTIRVAVEGRDVTKIINTMIEDGTLEKNFMTGYSFDVTLKKYNDGYRIPYTSNANSQFYNAIYLLEFIRWISNI